MKIDIKNFVWLTMLLTLPLFSCYSGGSNDGSGGNGDDQNIDNITKLMTAGWNLGNTLDAHWDTAQWSTVTIPRQQETMWGNPVTTKAMIDKIKASGFNTIRIPVTWYIFTGEGPEYKIADAWMNRVQEVVDYVINNGMFCILNTHHEEYKYGQHPDLGEFEIGWLRLYYSDKNGSNRPLSNAEKTEIRRRLTNIWKQIAERFKDYDQHLIFEGVNEPRTANLEEPFSRQIWNEQNNFLNELLQTFVDTVRACGGKNTDRYLMVSPYFASVGMDPNDRDGRIASFINSATGKLRINDSRNRLIVSLHYYEPWGFAAAPETSEYFSSKFDLNVSSVSYNIDAVLKIIRDNFTAKGIPVVMGETGAMYRDIPGHEAERVKWAEYYIAKLRELGVPVVIWDDGGDYKLFDRSALTWKYPDLAAAIVAASQAP